MTIASAKKVDVPSVYLIVSGLVRADQIQFVLKNASDIKAGAQNLKVGKYLVSVTYSCQGSLSQFAHQGALFFKLAQLALDRGTGKTTVSPPTVDIRDFPTAVVHPPQLPGDVS